jgi:hypothetical protein
MKFIILTALAFALALAAGPEVAMTTQSDPGVVTCVNGAGCP